ASLLVLRVAPHGEHLEETREPELRVAAVLDEGAIEGRPADVSVGGDEAGRDDAIESVHCLVDAAVEARTYMEDAVALDHHHAVAEESVALAVENNDVAGADRNAFRFCHGACLLRPLVQLSPRLPARCERVSSNGDPLPLRRRGFAQLPLPQ